MRLLVFEFITGGGLVDQALPESLMREGSIMRDALLDDLCVLKELKLLLMCDARIAIEEIRQYPCIQYITVAQQEKPEELIAAQQDCYDAVWLIAPETEGILLYWSHFFSKQGKPLLSCDQRAVEICQDKYLTYTLLHNASIPCVPSEIFNSHAQSRTAKWVFKVNNSVGCDQVYLLESEQHWQEIALQLKTEGQYILQPYINGKVLSLSCLFYQGQAYFICCNEQHMNMTDQKFELLACTVNVQTKKSEQYQMLCQQIAAIIPHLFGYVGIDFIQTDSGENLILEINPRLTTSYAGIKEALGINVADLVLAMINHQPLILSKTKNQPVYIDINQGRN